jgi:putative aminopeptidase FrvX
VAKIKIDNRLYDRIKKVSQIAGYSSVEELITHVLEKELETLESSEGDQTVAERLRGLGYID